MDACIPRDLTLVFYKGDIQIQTPLPNYQIIKLPLYLRQSHTWMALATLLFFVLIEKNHVLV
jgi:hypothetical protein